MVAPSGRYAAAVVLVLRLLAGATGECGGGAGQACEAVLEEGDSAALLQRHVRQHDEFVREVVEAETGFGHQVESWWNRKPKKCPPKTAQPTLTLNLTEYIRASWYTIEQQPNSYQPPPLECVTATYDLATKEQLRWKVPFFNGDVVLVHNYQSNGQANLCGSVTKPKLPSSLSVAPCFLPPLLAGDYWVIHAEANADGTYRWAIISAGAPTTEVSDGCTATGGLWIFSRAPTLSAEDLAAAKAVLVKEGYALSLLQTVKQDNCTYAGADLKPRAEAVVPKLPKTP